MIYDERYRDQIFWENSYSLDYASFKTKLLELAMNKTQFITPPAGKDAKTVGIGFLIAVVVAAAAGFITHLITGAEIGAVVVAIIAFFMVGTVTAVIVARIRLIVRPGKMTQEVNAKCVGYSLTGSDGHMNRCPVFKYTYGGREYLAYEGNYSNRGEIPEIDSTVTIRVDHDDPAEFVWNDSNNQKTFVFSAVICAIMILVEIAMLVITLSDKGLMGS